MSLKTLAGFYDDDWMRKLKDSIIPPNSAIIDEIERLKKMHNYGGLANQIEELLRSSRDREEMMKGLIPSFESIEKLTASLRSPTSELLMREEHFASYNAIHSANAAIADIIDQRKHFERLAEQTAAAMSAINTSGIADIARLNQ